MAPHRDLTIDWRSVSLEVRNEHRPLADEYAARVVEPMDRSSRLLRVVEALRDADRHDLVRPVYRRFGQHFHHGEPEEGLRFDVGSALALAGADPSFASAYDDPRWDDAVRASTREAERVAGDDVGTPVIAWQVEGRWTGFFGPVIASLPSPRDCLALWDGIALLVQVPGFSELKRHRDVALDLGSAPV